MKRRSGIVMEAVKVLEKRGTPVERPENPGWSEKRRDEASALPFFLFSRGKRRFPDFPKDVKEGEDRVAAPHPGTGMAHHLPDAVPEIVPVAVNGAAAAGRLVLAVRAAAEAFPCVLE
jgi:hypothetical protein